MKPSDADPDIIWLGTADSTNSILRRQIPSLDNLSIIAAREQTAGRGQGTHTWYATPGANLTFSILYRFGGDCALAASEAILITQVTTLALRDYLLKNDISARIKWPNDIWVGDRKICGILIENILSQGAVLESIVGIGLNVNESDWPSDLPNPVSMYELTGRTYDIRQELPRLQQEIRRRFGQLASPDGRLSLQEEFGKYMFRLPEEPR
ncbi:MAG: biotin--[acetyl-CoA-carboxylase] ligase [Bacteroidales bacterium]|nr:biotin--[acetyl-CoA-carboxylase] ligase [Bacteroidales bacterium]